MHDISDKCEARYLISCYVIVYEHLNWQSASSRCQSMGGRLVYINSQAENDVIYSLIKSKIYMQI